MQTSQSNNASGSPHVIRPALHEDQIRLLGRDLPAAERRKIQKALRTLHSLEVMAVNIYRYQITRTDSELNRRLIAAMCNEMTHVQDFCTALYACGMTPSIFRMFWWTVGLVFGLGSRLMGPRMILKTGIWVESKAVHHYAELIDAADWDPQIRKTIAKDAEDEQIHIDTWKQLAGELSK